MIILIIIFSLIVGFAVLHIILHYAYRGNYYDREETDTATGVCFLIFFIAFAICGAVCLVSKTNNVRTRSLKIELENKIEYLNATKEILESTIDSSSTLRTDIVSYNKEVAELKTEIETKHINLNNPWVNWFVDYYWADYSPDCVSYIR